MSGLSGTATSGNLDITITPRNTSNVDISNIILVNINDTVTINMVAIYDLSNDYPYILTDPSDKKLNNSFNSCFVTNSTSTAGDSNLTGIVNRTSKTFPITVKNPGSQANFSFKFKYSNSSNSRYGTSILINVYYSNPYSITGPYYPDSLTTYDNSPIYTGLYGSNVFFKIKTSIANISYNLNKSSTSTELTKLTTNGTTSNTITINIPYNTIPTYTNGNYTSSSGIFTNGVISPYKYKLLSVSFYPSTGSLTSCTVNETTGAITLTGINKTGTSYIVSVISYQTSINSSYNVGYNISDFNINL